MKLIIKIFLFTFFVNQSFAQFDIDFKKAEEAYFKNNYKKALSYYKVINDKFQAISDPYLIYKIACCNYELKNYKLAQETFYKIIELRDVNNRIKGNSYWYIARIYSIKNKKRKSLINFIKASDYVKDSRLYSTIAYKQTQLGKYKKALLNLNKAIELDSLNAYAYSNRGLLYFKKSDYKKARIDIEKSIRLDPKNPYAYKHSAMIYIKQKKYGLAYTDLKKAKELGYKNFGNESDADDVEKLLKKCNRIIIEIKQEKTS